MLLIKRRVKVLSKPGHSPTESRKTLTEKEFTRVVVQGGTAEEETKPPLHRVTKGARHPRQAPQLGVCRRHDERLVNHEARK